MTLDPSYSQTTETLDQLLGDGPFRTMTVTLTDDPVFPGVYERGTVLGRITAGGAYRKNIGASVDGSEVASAILVKQADASGGDVEAEVYVGGGFNENAMIYAEGASPAVAERVREDLRGFAIYTSPVPAGYTAA